MNVTINTKRLKLKTKKNPKGNSRFKKGNRLIKKPNYKDYWIRREIEKRKRAKLGQIL